MICGIGINIKLVHMIQFKYKNIRMKIQKFQEDYALIRNMKIIRKEYFKA